MVDDQQNMEAEVSTRVDTKGPDLTADEARRLTAEAMGRIERLGEILLVLHERRGYIALGYKTWSSYVDKELDLSRSRSYQILNRARLVREITDGVGEHINLADKLARSVGGNAPRVISKARELVSDGKSMEFAIEAAAIAVRRENQAKRAAEKAQKERDAGKQPDQSRYDVVVGEDEAAIKPMETPSDGGVQVQESGTKPILEYATGGDQVAVPPAEGSGAALDTGPRPTSLPIGLEPEPEPGPETQADLEPTGSDEVVPARSGLEAFQDVVYGLDEDDLEDCWLWFDEYCREHGGVWWMER